MTQEGRTCQFVIWETPSEDEHRCGWVFRSRGFTDRLVFHESQLNLHLDLDHFLDGGHEEA